MEWENNFWEDDFSNMSRRMNRLFRNFFRAHLNKSSKTNMFDYRKAWTDFEETENSFILSIELPGIEKQDIDLHIIDNTLRIKAKRKQEKKPEENQYSYSKSYVGFYQSISLPDEAERDIAEANFNNGILTIKIPKKKEKIKDKKKIKIN